MILKGIKIKYFLTSLLFIGLLSFVGKTTNASDISVDELLNLTNTQRIEHGLQPLTINQKLTNAAQSKAYNMFDEDYWSHTSPSGKTPWDFIMSAEYDYSTAGENLARGYSTSNKVVNGWMSSAEHRKNILDPNFSEIGFAVIQGNLQDNNTTLVVQLFGEPTAYVAIAQTSPNYKMLVTLLYSLIN